MRAYSLDLREKIIHTYSRNFGLSSPINPGNPVHEGGNASPLNRPVPRSSARVQCDGNLLQYLQTIVLIAKVGCSLS
jgi:hypothetical protein